MRINWFKDENNLVYINGATQLAELERTLHFPGLEEAANELRKHPTPEGFTIKGHGRTSGRLFVQRNHHAFHPEDQRIKIYYSYG